MDTLQIENVLKEDPYTSRMLAGVFARDQLPKRLYYPCIWVVNNQPISEEGEHWTCAYFTADRKGEYFDSYGLAPKGPLKRHMVSYDTLELEWNKTTRPIGLYMWPITYLYFYIPLIMYTMF